jgi:organic radical activating enzyme
MFGTNKVSAFDDTGEGHHLKVVAGSPFYTIQGEGPFAGYPAVFLRLHGCHLRCTFCDTKFDDPDDPMFDVEHIAKLIDNLTFENGCKLVVLTGGEPTLQNINPLVRHLINLDYMVQIETAGTYYRECMAWPQVHTVVSPKMNRVNEKVSMRAACFKYVVSTSMEFTSNGIPLGRTQPGATRDFVLAPPESNVTPIYYSPMDEYNPEKNAANAQLALDLALRFGRRVLPQVHKVLAIKEPV